MYINKYICGIPFLGLPPEPEASMPLLLEIEGLSMPMSGGGGGLVDNCIGATCGGGLVDEEAHDTCEGEGARGGGRRSMDGVVADTSGLGGGGRIRRVGRLVNGAFGDACCSK